MTSSGNKAPIPPTTLLVGGIICLFSFLIHFFIMVFLIRIRVLRQKKSNQLLININLGHMISGISLFLMNFTYSSVLSHVNYAFYSHGNVAMVILTIDRCIMIRWPYRYQALPAWVQIIFLATSPCTAVVSISVGLLSGRIEQPAMGDSWYRQTLLFGISTYSITLFVVNSIVYLVIRKQKRSIRAGQIGQELNNKDRVTRIRRDIASFYACFGYIITYIVLWMPELIRQYIWYFTGQEMGLVFTNIALILIDFNPICDAFVFVFFNKELKSHLRRIFTRQIQQE